MCKGITIVVEVILKMRMHYALNGKSNNKISLPEVICVKQFVSLLLISLLRMIISLKILTTYFAWKDFLS